MYCSTCGKELRDEAVVCPGCGCMVRNAGTAPTKRQRRSLKPSFFLISSIVSFFISAVSVGVEVYREVNSTYTGTGIYYLKQLASEGSQSAIAELNEYHTFVATNNVLAYMFWIFLVVSIALIVIAILKRREFRKNHEA